MNQWVWFGFEGIGRHGLIVKTGFSCNEMKETNLIKKGKESFGWNFFFFFFLVFLTQILDLLTIKGNKTSKEPRV